MKEGRLARMSEKIGSCHTARLLASLLARNAYAASFLPPHTRRMFREVVIFLDVFDS